MNEFEQKDDLQNSQPGEPAQGQPETPNTQEENTPGQVDSSPETQSTPQEAVNPPGQLSAADFVAKRRVEAQAQQVLAEEQAEAELQKNLKAEPVEVHVPGPEANAELDKEVEDALGDVSLVDLYGMNESEAKPQVDVNTKSSEVTAPGVLRGTVVRVAKDGVYVGGLGGRSEGFLPNEEFQDGEELQEGAVVDVVIVRYDSHDGLLILSVNAAAQELMRRNLKKGAYVEGRVTSTNKGGLELKIKGGGGLKAFMPISQIDVGRVEDLDPYVNQMFICEVTQVDRGDKNVVVSRRNVMLKERESKMEEVWGTLEKGQLHQGTVRSIMEYGAFVDMGGIDGMVHVSEMSWSRIDDPKELLTLGQTVSVIIKDINQETKKISLSIKMATGNPWDTVATKYAVGSHHQAQVVRLMDFGVFAQLEPGIDGLIPISEMSWVGRVNHPSEIVKGGEMVEVEILKVDTDKNRISMSMKSLKGDPWAGVEERYMKEEVYTGKVARLTDFGAFVCLEPGVDGLIHISEMSDKRVNRASDVVKEGEEVQVKVLEVDPSAKRISLSMKALLPVADVAVAADEAKAGEAAPPKKKKKRPLRGGLD